MKKFFVIALALSAVTFISLSTTAETIEKDNGYISVNASETKEISPNQAEITIGVETSDKSLQKASDDNKVIANKIYTSLKSILGPEDYIKTNRYTARPTYYTKDNKRVFDKYIVTNTVTVRTKKLDLVSKFVDTAIGQGATNINSLNFSITDYDTSCNETLAILTKQAYAKANVIAKSINSQVTGIKYINTTCNSENNQRPYYAMMDAAGAAEKTLSTPIEGGKIRIYANIDASFYVK